MIDRNYIQSSENSMTMRMTNISTKNVLKFFSATPPPSQTNGDDTGLRTDLQQPCQGRVSVWHKLRPRLAARLVSEGGDDEAEGGQGPATAAGGVSGGSTGGQQGVNWRSTGVQPGVNQYQS